MSEPFRVLSETGLELAACHIPLERRLESLHWMRFIRQLDRRMAALVTQGRVGFYGACTGQEAVAVGAALAALPEDWIFPALRESPIMLVRGFPLARYIAQLFGTADDVLRGRQMPSHMSARAVQQVSWSSAIGTQLPHAVGAAYAAKQRAERGAVLAFLGDGATSTGDFHAALNFSGVLRVPCVFICQNNQYSISCPLSRQTRVPELSRKAFAYGIEGLRVDGNDVLAVAEVIGQSLNRARRASVPVFVECVTYRLGPHSSSDDPRRYRSQGEEQAWQERDPVARLARHLQHRGVLDAAELAARHEANEAQISAAIAQAEAAGPPPLRSLFEDVYAELPWHLQEQNAELALLLDSRIQRG